MSINPAFVGRPILAVSRPEGRLQAEKSTPRRSRKAEKGGALLIVLWLSAALASIAFTVAHSVRSETERVSTDTESLRAHYLATGAIERTILWSIWGDDVKNPDGSPRYYHAPMPWFVYEFPGGEARVEFAPETSKLDINTASPEQLERLLLAAGADPDRARTIVLGVVDWRTGAPDGALTDFDQYYLSLVPSFRSRHASFQEIEELLLIRGMTPELFYGGYRSGANGSMVPYGGLKDMLSVYGSTNQFDVNTVSPTLLASVGFAPDEVAAIVARRAAAPIKAQTEIPGFVPGDPRYANLIVGGGTIWTIRATARPRLPNGQLSNVKRSAGAMVKYLTTDYVPPYDVMRWYDDDPSIAPAVPLPAAGNGVQVLGQ